MDIFIQDVSDIKTGKAGDYFIITTDKFDDGGKKQTLICKETEWHEFIKGQEHKTLHGFITNEKYPGKFYLEKEGGKKVAEEAPKPKGTRDDTTNKSIEAQVACKAGTEIWCKHIEGDKPIDSKSLSGQVIKATAQYILEKLGHEATVILDKVKEEP